MSRLILSLAAIALAGCASMGEWRTLSIDSSSEAAFGQSVSLMNDELPDTKRQLFALALVNIARTGIQSAGRTQEGVPAYTLEAYRAALDGLTYDGVIALADRSGTPVSEQYRGERRPNRPVVNAGFSGSNASNQGQPVFMLDGQPTSDYRPGGQYWPLGADANGHAIYPSR